MDHTYTEDERMIGEAAQALFDQHCPMTAIRDFIESGAQSPLGAEALGQSGLLGVVATADADGAALGAAAALQVVTAAATHLAPFPVADAIVAAAMLAQSHTDAARDVIAGRRLIVIAPGEPLPVDAAGRVSGWIAALPYALAADAVVIATDGPDGTGHRLIDLARPGVTCTRQTGIDPSFPLGDLLLEGVETGAEDEVGPVDPRWDRLRVILMAGELMAAAQVCLNLAVDYMKVRRQFGHEIGKFQALKHIAANGALGIESMKAAIDYAAWAHDQDDADAAMSASIAKSYASDHARRVAEDALQCHGAIGFTWDYDLQLYMRRILRLAASGGTVRAHRAEIARMLRDRIGMEQDAR
ncbi:MULTISPECIES: acyl-CoA dehydrogenase family protein [unclassified Sphingobium]|uniref:acyl-CoA dehydrogenase family protein n=1 Tax=unclassified Sphingobium TaxID=2611147 RepID=UPI000D174624|nr:MULTISPECIES: acyl-CoA dehydrogenase family protein [unclassified Sphingobium]MBG6119999.1 alkylation response protein AidB-like acyl-CoA dehydrogenase [Sphingobium sp. JAI105]PSO12939.1 hypothetical protein C7E20_04110 [Sphingobium sp. AEW4]TWD05799.1 alkylation response protein AidB-like acyl-CoA dehydrogenase [Sphingobium sp. AEW010]TWD23352.1 alkylation response protein AidB-like acyl-CoA dehydrogenase [Sphingobium sp. AEW013]TWD25212.1 alkylation response protein AidB-like acyl-CoA deh